MSSSAEPTAATGTDARPNGGFGLRQAIALIVGNIIGVGIFNLPGSLVRVWPDHVVVDGAGHCGCPGSGAALCGTISAAAHGWWTLRVLAGGVRQPRRVRECVVVLDHGVGGQCRDRDRLGALRGVSADPGRGAATSGEVGPDRDRAGRTLAAGVDQPEWCVEDGRRCRSSPLC